LQDVHKIAADSQQEDDTLQKKFRERPIKRLDLGSREALANETYLVWYPAEVDVSIRPGWFYHSEEDDKLKSVETLLRFYETAAGGNAVLLLNIPPDREGRIHETDCQRLAELGKAIRSIYSDNLLEAASVQAKTVFSSSYNSSPSSTDGANVASSILIDDETYWRPIGDEEKAELEITLAAPAKLSHLDLREQIRESQRIEAFSLYAEKGEKNGERNWEKIYSGTTVGYRKICRFEPVEASRLRIVIEESRIYPTLRFVGAYLEK
jgi:alpha-L-fucosidase